MARIIVAFLLFLSGAVLAWAQDSPTEDTQDTRPTEQKVITDPDEYNVYIAALNTLDPAARKAAFDSFLEKFPNSVMRDEALNFAMDALVQLDNQQTRSILRQSHIMPRPVEPTPQERACKLARETPEEAMSIQEWEFILQYRDSGSPCNNDAAERTWRRIQKIQKDAMGKPSWITLPQVRVISVTARYIDVAITDDNQKAGNPDLRVTMAAPLAKPPAPGSIVDVTGTISNYSTRPFMFIMTGREISVAKRSDTLNPGQGQK